MSICLGQSHSWAWSLSQLTWGGLLAHVSESQDNCADYTECEFRCHLHESQLLEPLHYQ